jgi:hypothetical protein
MPLMHPSPDQRGHRNVEICTQTLWATFRWADWSGCGSTRLDITSPINVKQALVRVNFPSRGVKYELLSRFPCVANLNSTFAAPVRPTTIVSPRGWLNCKRADFEQINTWCRERNMLRLDYLSCFLTILSTVLIGKKLWQGWVVAGANSIIICVIGMRTAEFGLLPGNLFCIGLYANNVWNWRPKAQIANSRSRLESQT